MGESVIIYTYVTIIYIMIVIIVYVLCNICYGRISIIAYLILYSWLSPCIRAINTHENYRGI